MNVHLRNLRYFVAVAEELHFTRAAERLHVSQPALSKQIRLLERDFGYPLLRRDRRSVELTKGGETLLGPARELIRAWDEAVERATAKARTEAKILRVGFHTSVAGELYSRSVALFVEAHPGWKIELKLHDWSNATAGVLDGASDIAFLWLPVPGRKRLALRTLRTEPRYAAMPAGHPLAAKSSLSIKDLLDEPFVALPPEAGALRDFWLALDQRNGHPARVGATADTPDAAFEAVAAGQGIVLLAQGNAELYARPGITSRPVSDLVPCELAVAWRRGDKRAPIEHFADAAQRATNGPTNR